MKLPSPLKSKFSSNAKVKIIRRRKSTKAFMITTSMSVWIWVGHPDDGSKGDATGGGDECAGGAVHLARRSPADGGDSEIGGDGDGVVIARSLSTSASGGRDM
ncbi:hypothetical protein Tco_0513183, partial [Tanacetum coccineum]